LPEGFDLSKVSGMKLGYALANTMQSIFSPAARR
jgi:hypothetical protein